MTTTKKQRWQFAGRHCTGEAGTTARHCAFMKWVRLEDDGEPAAGGRYGQDWILRPVSALLAGAS